MKSSIINCFALLFLILLSTPTLSQTCNNSDASATTYNDGWQNGENDGAGFGPWSLSGTSNSGFFMGSSTNNGDGDSNGDGDINTSNRAFGLFANSSNLASASRSFNQNLGIEDTFSLDMDNGWIDGTNAEVGFDLRNLSNEILFQFYFNQGDANYTLNVNGGEQDTGIGFTDEGLSILFTRTGVDTFDLLVVKKDGGTSTTLSGTFFNTTSNDPAGMTLFNFNAGGGSQRDAYFNNFEICIAGDTEAPVLTNCIDINIDSCGNQTLALTPPNVSDNFDSTTSLDFDGSNDRVIIPDDPSLSFTTQMTIQAWIYPEKTTYSRLISNYIGSGASTTGEFILDTYNGSAINGRGLRFETINNNVLGISVPNVLTLNSWNHVTVTFDNGNIKLFVNGIVVGSTTIATTNLGIGGKNIILGEDRNDNFPENFDGRMDEVRFWNIALSESEIANSFNSILSGDETGLVAYYDFEDGIGSTIISDRTINGNDGSLDNMDPNTDWSSSTAPFNNVVLINDFTGTSNATGVYPIGSTVVTWTATDVAGNSSQCTQTITVTDSVAPEIICSDLTVSNDPGLCEANVTVNSPTVSDNCSINLALDFDGNNDYISLPKQNLLTGLTYQAWIKTTSNASTSNYDGNSALSIIGDKTNGIWNSFGISNGNLEYHHFTGTWQVISSSQTINDGLWHNVAVTHDQSTGSVKLYVDGVEVTNSNIAYGTGGGAAAVGFDTIGASFSFTSDAGEFFEGQIDEVGVWNRPLTSSEITDNFNALIDSNGSGLVLYYDFEDGVGASTTADNSGNGNNGTLINMDPATDWVSSFPNSSGITLTNDITGTSDASGVYPVGDTTVTWTATDAAGNSTTCTQIITVEDTEAPIALCRDLTLQLDENGSASISVENQVLANSSTDFDGTQGTNNWTYGKYSAFNTTGFSQLPNFSGFVWNNPGNILDFPQLDPNGGHPQIEDLTWAVRRWTSNYSGEIVISGDFFDRDGNCGDGANVRIFQNDTQVYEFLNIPTSSQTYSLTLNVSNGDTIDFAIDPKFDAGCDDTHFVANISTTAGINNGSSDNCGNLNYSLSQDTFTCADLGANSVTLTVTDDSGNQASCTATVTVEDLESPEITCPSDIISDASSASGAAVTWTEPVTSDNCPNPQVVVTSSPTTGLVNGSEFPIGTTTVTYTTTDSAGNTDACSFDVVITGLAPSIVCPGDITTSNDSGACGAIVNFSATETTGIPASTITYSQDPGTEFPVGMTSVTATATNAVGTSSCTFTVTVTDNEAPVLTCASDISVSTDLDKCDATGVVLDAPFATDNCGVVSLTNDAPTEYLLGSTTVTWTATDAAGNVSTCQQTVTVNDSQVPTALCVSDVIVELDATGNGTLTTAEVDAGSFDNCGAVSLSLSQTAFTCADIGGGGSSGPAITELFLSEYIEGGGNNKCIEIYNGTGAAVDLAAGNYAIIRYSNGSTNGTTINLSGTIADGDVYVVCNNSATSAFTSQADQTSSQINYNGDDAVALTKNGSNIDIFGQIGVDPGSQWSVGGNMTANRTLVRNPEVLSGNTLNSAGFPTLGTEWTEFPQDTATNLGSHTVNTPSGGGGSSVTLTVTDASGNVSTCDVNVTVVDINGPVPDLSSLPDVNSQCEVTSLAEPTATDACGGTVTVSSDASFPITTTGTTVVTWTYTDQYGNETEQTQNIVIADTEAPTAVCQDITVELDAAGNAILTPDLFDSGSSDNCDDDLTLSIDITSVDCSNLGTPAAAGDVAWINEFHYDNTGADENEFVEVAANFDASSYQIIFYNGSNGTSYGSGSLTFSSTDSGYNFYTVNAPSGGIQNGAPDGIALVNGSNVIEFISYEGTFSATNGVAAGMNSTNIGVSQTSSTPVGSSIHRVGSGGQASDFTWTNTTANSSGSINTGQTLVAPISGGAVVTLTVTDDAGNQSTCTANVTVLDKIAPSPDVAQLSDVTAECEVLSLTAPSATDNCGGSVTVTNDANLPISTLGTTVVTWTYEDESGNTSTQTQNLVINDITAPEAICQDITVSLDASGLATWTAADINNGSTDNCGIQSIAIDNSSFDCNDVPKLLISGVIDGPLSGGVPKAVELYVLADIADLSEFGLGSANNGGGSDGEEFTFPSVSVSAGTYIYIASEPTGFTSFFGFAPDYTAGFASINGDDAIELFRNGTVIDVFGDINTDGTGEVWDYADGWAYRNANSGPDGDIFNASNWTYSGTNALDNETDNNTAANPFPAGGFTTSSGITFSTSVILTVTDINGNTDTCTATVTVEDNIDPTIACPADITVNNDPNSCGAMVTFTAPAGSDNCAGAATTQTAGLESGSVFPIGSTTNTFEVTDSFGNSVECSFTVTVIDNEAPSITCPADITVSNDSGACDAVVSYTLVSNDNCPDATITQTSGLASGEAFPIGTTTNTFLITDASGNTNSCSFTVTVNDTEAPVLTCPSDITLDNDLGHCGAQVVYNVSGSDNCPNETLTQTAGLPSGALFPVGTTTVSYELEDASGNLVSCTFNVTVNDSEAPTINCPSNIVAVNDAGLCSAVVDYTVTSGDNCPGATVTQTSGLASGSAFPIGLTTNTFVITDAAGNSTSCSFDIQVNDAEAPIISCPTDITVSNDLGECSAVVDYVVNGSDNCPGSTITQTSGLASGSAFPIGITTNTFQITDAAGNTSTCSFNVTVNDTESPEITCPGNITLSNDPGLCGAEVAYAVTGSDNCPGTTIAQTTGLPSGSLFPIGITINTFTITDSSGNSATCSFEVKVDDTEAPVITCPTDIITGNDPGSCDAIVTYTIVSSDNCPGASIVQLEGLPSGAQFPIGDTMNKFEITDAAGNSTICDFLVTVEDTESPIPSASLPDIIAQCEATVLPPIAPDNCKGDVTGTTSDPTTYTAQGTYVITWLYDDGSGNTTTQTQNVIIDDTTAPDTPILNPIVGQCFAAVPTPTTIDNCAGVISGTTTDATNYTAQGTYTVNWTFDDGNGNVITVPQTVIVDDLSNPVPDVTNLPTLTAECSLDVLSIPTATDNCLGVINATTNDPLSYTAQGTYTITWTYDDGNGNAVSQTQTVIIDDVTAPDPVVLSDVVEQCSATVTAPTTTDNCAGPITGTTSDPLVYTSQGNYLITWNFDDGNGNSFNVTQNVIIDDTEAPVPDNASLATITGQCEVEVTTVPTATDNCKGQVQGTTTDALVYNTQGVYTITWSYDDGNGNVSTQTQTVIVEDTTDPVISGCPTDITLCGAQAVSWTAPTASDNCEVILTSTHEPGDLFDLGTTTVIYTATDAAGNTATCSFDVTINANPIISIVESPLDDFCQGIGELTVVISNESELQLPIDISWSNGSSDESIIVNDNNTYTVTVISGNGCSATASFASTTNPQDVLSGHVMIGKRGVRLFGSRVFGNVGVTDNNRTAQVRAFSQVYGFVRSDNIFTDWFSFVQTPIFSDSDVTLPTFYNNTTPNNCGDDITVQPNTTVTLDEEIYDNVYVRYGATLIIDSPEVYIDRLRTESGVTIIFNQPSAVMIDKQMRIGRYNTIDRNGNGAIFYVEKDVTIDRSADIDVNIYSKRSIKVRRSSFFNRTTMRGLFIALRNVESSFFVDWYPGSGCGVTPIPDGPSPCNSLITIDDDDDDDDDEFEADRVTLFPVPARDVLNVTFESPTTTKATCAIASMRGEVSIQSAWDVEKGHNEEKVDVTRLSDGIYSIIISLNGETISKQFVVKRDN